MNPTFASFDYPGRNGSELRPNLARFDAVKVEVGVSLFPSRDHIRSDAL